MIGLRMNCGHTTSRYFGDPNLPLPEVDEEILTTLEAKDMSSTPNATLVHLLDRAMVPASDEEESAVRDFAFQLFDLLGYSGGNIITRTRKSIPHLICGEWRVTITDVCLIDSLQDDDIILFVHEDKRFRSEGLPDPRPQLIGDWKRESRPSSPRCVAPINLQVFSTQSLSRSFPASSWLVQRPPSTRSPSPATLCGMCG